MGPIQRPEKVFVTPNEILFFKSFHRVHEVPREIQTLAHLQKTGLSEGSRIPTLHDSVQYQQETDQICGLLLTYVKHEQCLSFIDANEAPLQRQKWISQIRHTISKLHTVGIVWGDVKPDNILIDENDDLWFIDFGGSFTQGWADEDIAETVEGDCQGMNRIVDFLLGEYEAP